LSRRPFSGENAAKLGFQSRQVACRAGPGRPRETRGEGLPRGCPLQASVRLPICVVVTRRVSLAIKGVWEGARDEKIWRRKNRHFSGFRVLTGQRARTYNPPALRRRATPVRNHQRQSQKGSVCCRATRPRMSVPLSSFRRQIRRQAPQGARGQLFDSVKKRRKRNVDGEVLADRSIDRSQRLRWCTFI